MFIKQYSGKRAKYGFTGLYAYAGSDAYFGKRQYIVIALAPMVLFGMVSLALNLLLPSQWFWAIYILQIMNLSGTVGDFYVTYPICRFKSDVLTHDEGFTMVFYSKNHSIEI